MYWREEWRLKIDSLRTVNALRLALDATLVSIAFVDMTTGKIAPAI